MDSSNINLPNHTNSRFNVVIRIRPELGDETNDLTTEDDLTKCVNKISDRQLNLTKPLSEEIRTFTFDYILDDSSTQELSYNKVGSKIVSDVMEGYNGTIMAYGQTGSGKTYTIFGKTKSMDYQYDIDSDMGIVPRSIKQIFNTILENANKIQYQIRVSFMQVYMEQISDLIPDDDDTTSKEMFVSNAMVFNTNKKRENYTLKNGLQIREDPKTGIFVKGLKQIRVTSEEELLELIKYGSKFRITNATSMNKYSSRSHAILQVLVEQKWVEKDSDHNQTSPLKKRHYKKGLLTIVDLAGSERISKSGSQGLSQEEAKKINVSISSLGNVINALANNTDVKHVPFRDSKLTRILTECIGGNSKTSICACVSPFLMNYEETFTTLQFASRANVIQVHAKVNEKIEMKKIKEKINDLIKIKKIESILKENKKLEDDANDLKKSFIKIKDDLKQAKAKDTNTFNRSTERSKSVDMTGHKVNLFSNTENKESINMEESYSNITKKFQCIILHLQTELAKSLITVNSLREENLRLKERLKTNFK